MTVEDMNREGHKVLGYTPGYKNVLTAAAQDKPTDAQRKETEQKDIVNKIYKFLDNPDVKGKDGKVSKESYKAAKRAWTAIENVRTASIQDKRGSFNIKYRRKGQQANMIDLHRLTFMHL